MTPDSGRHPFTGCIYKRQDGAIAVVTALFILFVGLFFIALAVDTGRLYFENRSLQRIADAVALDAVHDSGLCGAGELNMEAAQAAAARNGFAGTFGEEGNQVLLGVLREVDDGGEPLVVREFLPAAAESADAVYVRVSRSVPRSIFLAGLFGDEVTLSKEAVARRLPIVSMSVGSGVLEMDTQQSEILNAVLGELLNTELSLSAVTYEGLATARVSLADLVEAHSGVGTVSELLQADLGVGEMMEVFVEAAAAAGESTVGLDGLLTGGVGLPPLSLGDILSVTSPSPEAGLEAQVGLFDLITATALFANRDNAVVVPLGTDLNLAGLANVGAELELYVIEPPQIAVGPPGRNAAGVWRTETSTAQVRTSVITQASTNLNVLGLTSAEASVVLGVALEAAEASARAESVVCSTYAQQRFQPTTIDADSGLTSLNLGRFSNNGADDSIEDNTSIDMEVCALSLLGVEICLEPSVSLQADSVTLPGQQGTLVYEGARDDLPETQRLDGIDLGAGLESLADGLEVEIEGLGILTTLVSNLVNLLTDALLGELLVPLVSELDVILTPVLEALGISVGIADVTLMDMEMGPVDLAL